MQTKVQLYLNGALLVACGLLVGILVVTGGDDGDAARIASLEKRLDTFQKHTQEWSKHMVRNQDALRTWQDARSKELEFQSSVLHKLDIVEQRLNSQSCVICQVSGRAGGCVDICLPRKETGSRAN